MTFSGEDDMYGLDASKEKSIAIAKIRIDEINKLLKVRGKGSISNETFLEVGCAYGHTLIEARNQGASIADGIEFSDNATAACIKSGLNVKLGNVNEPLEKYLVDKRYDIISAYSLLEHVNDPISFLSGVRSLLETDGLLVIRVPKMSPEGPWLSLLDHFWHFTSVSLKKHLRLLDSNY